MDASRRANDGQVDRAIATVEAALGGLDGVEVLVLGLTYRDGVKELAYSRALPLISGLKARGARVLAYDPLLSEDEIAQAGAAPWSWSSEARGIRAIVTQTGDPLWASLDPTWFPTLNVVLDGRNSLRGLELPAHVGYHGVGVPGRDASQP